MGCEIVKAQLAWAAQIDPFMENCAGLCLLTGPAVQVPREQLVVLALGTLLELWNCDLQSRDGVFAY